jgi:hypothetical protein
VGEQLPLLVLPLPLDFHIGFYQERRGPSEVSLKHRVSEQIPDHLHFLNFRRDEEKPKYALL